MWHEARPSPFVAAIAATAIEALFQGMAEWIVLKDWLVDWFGLDRDAIHVLAGVAILFAAAALLRRPIASPWPWLCVLLIELANEAVSGLADGVLQDWEIAGSRHDLWVTMLLPTVLTLSARLTPRIYHRQDPVYLPQPLRLEAAPIFGDPVDAEYVEVDEQPPAGQRP